MFKISSLLCTAGMVVGCASTGTLDRGAKLPTESETVVVVGITPKTARPLFFPGTVVGERFSQHKLSSSPLSGAPTDGFLVGKVSSEQTLAATMVTVATREDTVAFSKIFYVCGSGKTVAFKTPRGKVIYVGHFDYSSDSKTLRVRYGSDIEAARSYLVSSFPELAPALEPQPFDLLAVNKECPADEPNLNPVYIQFFPSRK